MSSNFPKEVQWLCSFMIRKCVHYLYICSAKKIFPSYAQESCVLYLEFSDPINQIAVFTNSEEEVFIPGHVQNSR